MAEARFLQTMNGTDARQAILLRRSPEDPPENLPSRGSVAPGSTPAEALLKSLELDVVE